MDNSKICLDYTQDVKNGSELGTTSTQGHPLKRVWDAALSLHDMGLLHFQVSTATCCALLKPAGSEVCTSGHIEHRQPVLRLVLGY